MVMLASTLAYFTFFDVPVGKGTLLDREVPYMGVSVLRNPSRVVTTPWYLVNHWTYRL